MGLPPWPVLAAWLRPLAGVLLPAPLPIAPLARKNPEVPLLPDYAATPPMSFWSAVPCKPLPPTSVSPVDGHALLARIESTPGLKASEIARGHLAVDELLHGASACQSSALPSVMSPNTPAAVTHGAQVMDNVVSWLKAGFASGPFLAPPLPNFRCNSILAVPQPGKVRVILNLSVPDGASFNDNINDYQLEKVVMSTARQVGYTIVACGRGARMWKYDLRDAYKNVPARRADFRLQGFRWLGMYFVETQLIFGARTSVAAFDRLGATLLVLAIMMSGILFAYVHRTLDDAPIVTPADSPDGPLFAAAYESLCAAVGVRLAPPCPDFEKAFLDSTVGTVLGVRFFTDTLTWRLSPKKFTTTTEALSVPLLAGAISLKDAQSLTGKLNDVCQMCPFLRAFRFPLNKFVASFELNEQILLVPPPQVLLDLRVFAAAILTARDGLPIPPRPVGPTLAAITFISDAAGARFTQVGGRRVPHSGDGDSGGASIRVDNTGAVVFCARLTWPASFLLTARDGRGRAYGCKTTTLEIIAMILPFLTIPHLLAGRHVVLQVDNAAAVYGWHRRHVSHDASASILLRALHLICSFLACYVHVVHVPRVSTPSSKLADCLSRVSTSNTSAVRRSLRHVVQRPPPAILLAWLHRPSEDWALANNLLHHVITITTNHI